MTSNSFSYGGIPIVYNSDPTDLNYRRIAIVNGNLNIPNSSVLTNKSLYEYKTVVIPKEKNSLRLINNEASMNKLVNDTYCCDDIMNRALVYNYAYDNSKNRYGTTQESYFD